MICSLAILKQWRCPKREKTSFEKRGMGLKKEGRESLYCAVFMNWKYIKIRGSKRAKAKITSKTFFSNRMTVG
ncbi:hypothetical protein ACSLMO_15465 [Flavobacterium columnare]|uniref:hypothetical protein n=1 Tax=Flavobacterium columnare TaxID=996 RepID=UPI004033E6EB